MTHESGALTPVSPSIRVVTVCYNSRATLEEWYRLTATPKVSVKFVDNASSDDVAPLARRAGAELIRSEVNVGFGRGCNLGLDELREEWVAFVNPDVDVTVDQLLALAARAPMAVVATSPLLVNSVGEAQPDVFRVLPSALRLIQLWLFGRKMTLPVPANATGRIRVQVTSGACLMVRSRALSRPAFPEWLFLNVEDIHLCQQLGAIGNIDVDTTIRVRHKKLSSASSVPMADIFAETARSTSAYAAFHFGLLRWIAVYVAIVCGFTMRALTRRWPPLLAFKLARLMMSEGTAILRGHPRTAGAEFVGRARDLTHG